jgi:minor histocompatibility antigen H13
MDQPQMLLALGFMITASIAVIVYGSMRNLKKLKASAKDMEIMSTGDAWAFPLQGSLALFSLYFAFKLVPKEYLNALLSVYLCVAAVFCCGGFLKGIVRPNVLTGLLCVGLGASYIMTKHWVINNILAVAIAVVAIENVQLGSFCTSAALLSGLFLYDIFWVFGTDVMVTVATNVDGPIKLVFPQTLFGSHEKTSLLGLGDIVIPGFFIAQTYIFSKLSAKKRDARYFKVAMTAYFCSLVNTMVVMVVFKHAQPALLYIVPWLLVSTFLAAVANGELKTMYEFDTDALVLRLHGKQAAEDKGKDGALSSAAKDDSLGLAWELAGLVLELFGLDEANRTAKKCSPVSEPTEIESKTKKKSSSNSPAQKPVRDAKPATEDTRASKTKKK